MSNYIQGGCQFCGSHDAMTTYPDGGYHCYSCGRHSSGNPYKNILGKKTPRKEGGCEPLPEDTVSLFDAHKQYHAVFNPGYGAENWVHKYGITDAEIDENNFCFSQSESLLIFPVYGNSYHDLIMWQGRYFGENKKHPKYLTKGKPDDCSHIITPLAPRDGSLGEYSRILLTEDLISAIKIGRQAHAMPLWGSHISNNVAMRLSRLYGSTRLWLDYDKRESSIKQCMKNSCTLKVTPIITSLDPKEYSDFEITQIIGE